MASNLGRFSTLVVIVIIAWTGFGSITGDMTEPETFYDMSHKKLNVTCVANGRVYEDKKVMQIEIKDQDSDQTIATVINQKVVMGPYNRLKMKADGYIDNDSRKSYLSLMINNSSYKDAGSYKCQMVVQEKKVNPIEKSATANVSFDKWTLSVVTKPQPYNVMTHNKMQITCIVDGPRYLGKIKITRQNPDEPIAIFMEQGVTMGLTSAENMKAEGNIDHGNSKSYLSLMIKNPSVKDAGLYQCMMVCEKGNKTIEKSVTTNVSFEESDIRDIVSHLVRTDRKQEGGLNSVQSDVNRVEKHLDTLVLKLQRYEYMRKKLACHEKGWTFYGPDQSCLKAFGKDRYSTINLNWHRAQEKCWEYGGDLVTIENKHKHRFVYEMLNKSIGKGIWIGIRNYGHDFNTLRYVNGFPIGKYQPWDKKYETVKHKICVGMYTNQSAVYKERWSRILCDARGAYACSISLNGCPTGGWYYYEPDQTCLKVFGRWEDGGIELPWKDANNFCRNKFHGNLVIIRNEEKNTVVQKLAHYVGRSKWPLWIGIRYKSKKGNVFQYVGGTPLGEYQPFFNKDKGHCVRMDPNSGGWMTYECQQRNPFVCSTLAHF